MSKKITETGPVGLKGLNQQEKPKSIFDLAEEYISSGEKMSPELVNSLLSRPAIEDVGLEALNAGYGESRFDEHATYSDLQDLQDFRAAKQTSLGKWVNGLSKGVVLAGTTFLDGTLGLLWGTGEMLANLGNKEESGWETFSRLWDNEFSNGMRTINEMSENILPNYRTAEERDRAWYQNLGTANFWADTFLKNLGFTVGAFYSGKGFTSVLKGANLIKTGLGAATAGSVYSAVNEARIEANHNSNDFYKLETKKLEDSYAQAYQDIQSSYYDSATKEEMIGALNQQYQGLQDNLNVRKSKMGLITFLGNAAFLSVNDFYTMGRLYAKGFDSAKNANKAIKGAKKTSTKAEADKLWAADQGLGKRVKGSAGKRSFDEITKLEALGIGGKKALLEGNEELFQKFVSSTAGEWMLPDSPDSYYKALLDEESQVETQDFLTSITNGFKDSYGNIDSYEEFAVGFLTGLLGTPTFGRVQNADASTYLGRGKAVGLSGGIFGELSMANKANQDMKEAIDYINQYETKLTENQNYFAQSQSFTKAMDGWSAQDNKWEFKNAENNDTFAAISRYASLGKLDWMRDLVNQDFENISDETLMSIARETSTDVAGWKNIDGSYTPDGEKGAKAMRESLIKKRDEILSDIDKYEDSLIFAKREANQSLTNDEANELAWYRWKIQKFAERFDSLKDETKSLDAIDKGLTQWETALVDERFYLTEDKDGDVFKENTEILKKIRTLKDFISRLKYYSSVDILALSKFIKDRKQIIDLLSDEGFYNMCADNSNLQYSEYKQAMDNISDLSKICLAYEEFNQRLREFTEDPLKLKNNRAKIEEQQKLKKEVADKDTKLRNLEEATNNELFQKAVNGEVSIDELKDIAGLDAVDSDGSADFDIPDDLSKKLEQVEELIDRYEGAKGELDSRLQNGDIDQQTYEDAITLLEKSKEVAELPDELLDVDIEALVDINNLNTTEIEAAMSDSEREETREVRLGNARGVINDINNSLESSKKPSKQTEDNTPNGETGRDTTPKVQTEQEKKQQEEELKVATKEDRKIANIIKNEVPKEHQGQAYKDFKNLVSNIRTLYNGGIKIPEIRNTVSKTKEYQNLAQYPKVMDAINDYIVAMVNGVPFVEETITTVTDNSEVTPMPENNIFDYNDKVRNAYRDTDKSGIVNGVKQYWTFSTTRYPIHKDVGDDRPYYEIAKTLKNPDGKPRYTPEELQRMEAVFKYLERNGTFALRDSDEIKVGDEIRFAIDPKLNNEAGSVVILMLDKNGNIVGDLQDIDNNTTSTFKDLPEFIDRTTKAYLENKDSLQENDLWISDEKTTIRQLLVGSVNYSQERHSLNEISVNQKGAPIKPIIGVVLQDGAISTTSENKAGNDPISSKAIRPLKLSAGQPVILIPTGVPNRTHIAVPFAMPYYNRGTSKVGLGTIIDDILNRIPNIQNSQDAIKITKALKEHLGRVWKIVTNEGKEQSIGSFEISYKQTKKSLNTNAELRAGINQTEMVPQVRITYKPNKDSSVLLDVTYDINDLQLVDKLKNELFGLQIPFRINRKYLNKQIDGVEYNSLLGELANTNVTPGAIHTINNWFSLNPIDKKGNAGKGSIIKSLGTKTPTTKVKSNNIKVVHRGVDYFIDTITWVVTDANGKKYGGPKTELMLAEAYGSYNNLDTTNPYDTPWGKYDSSKKAFTTQSVEEPVQEEQTYQTKEELLKQATSEGLLNSPKRKAMFTVLSDIQISKLLKYPKVIRGQVITNLERNFNSTTKIFKKNVEELLGVKYRKVDSSEYEIFDLEKEINWLDKVLPQYKDKTTLVKGLIKISEGNNPERAYGQFYMGAIILSDVAASGTVYHEAFHAVTNTILTDTEKSTMFDEARKLYGTMDDITLEEELAEGFRKYIQTEEMFGGTIIKIFRKIKHFITNFLNKESIIDHIYFNINNGKYSDRILKESKIVANRIVENIQHDVSELIQLQKELIKKPFDNEYQNVYEANVQIENDPILRKAKQLGVVTPVNNPRNNRGMISYNKSKLQNLINEREGRLTKAVKDKIKRDSENWFKEQSKESKESLNMLYWQDEFRDRDEYDEIEDYHTNKLMFGNLNMLDRRYVISQNFTIEEWNKLHPEHKEAILNCR